MDIWQIITLALLQGFTEFLPISSSAHLILVPEFTSWEDQGTAFDVAVHVGTLIAVIFYFRYDIKPLFLAWIKSLQTKQLTAESRLVWGVIVGTIPVAIAGVLISVTGWIDYLRSGLLIAMTTLIFGGLLWYADTRASRQRNEYQMTWQDIILIGCAQAIALLPGTSRSGITITAALLVGLSRQAAARFSFLLSIPVIILAGIDETALLLTQHVEVDWTTLILGMTISAISAYLCIEIFIRLLNQIGMLPFVIYRLILGVFLLIWYGYVAF
ncbi:undecaprenyl-diphosphate phosphatase [Candidatus Albibeggiatoa sp. nov. BB20]|uniref:undecaprenyl-diphosphate phosphatase n=1 Tax=Candidatus Albibeggiatoa sp. nov. BB20 TaxID=3162723 RepID=UPI003365548C